MTTPIKLPKSYIGLYDNDFDKLEMWKKKLLALTKNYKFLHYLSNIFGKRYMCLRFKDAATAVYLQTVRMINLVKHIWRSYFIHKVPSDNFRVLQDLSYSQAFSKNWYQNCKIPSEIKKVLCILFLKIIDGQFQMLRAIW